MIARNYLLSITVFLILDVTWSKQDDAWINSQIASDPWIQQLRYFAKIHQATSNNKKPQEVFYLVADDYPKLEYPRLTLKNVSSSIVTMSGDLAISGYSINLWNAYVLLFVEEKYIYFVVRGKISDNCPILTWLNLLLYLRDTLSVVATSLSWKISRTIFTIWNPLRSGIIGFGVHKDAKLNTAPFTFVYRNRTSHMKTTNRSIIAYIQEDFLQAIGEDMPETRTDGFIAFMYFIKNKISNLYDGVGFRIPQYCNRKGISPLKVYFDTLPTSNWTNFGSFQIPNNNIRYSTCLIEYMSYISFDISINSYYQSYESVKYCPPTIFKIGSHMAEFEVTAPYRLRFPKSLYFDHNMNILGGFCHHNSFHINDISSYIPMDISSLITNQTMIMYKPLVELSYADYSNISLPLNSDTSYIDVYLYILNVVILNAPHDRRIPLFTEGIKRLQSQAEYSKQISRLVTFVKLIAYDNDLRKEEVSNSEKSTFVIEDINNKDENIIGMVLYSNNSIKLLTSRYPTDKVVSDDSVDVIIQPSHYGNNDRSYLRVVIFTDKFYHEQAHVSKTKIVCLISAGPFFYSYSSYFDIYLKMLDGSNNGFWHNILIDTANTTFLFINESNKDICNPTLIWNILTISTPVRITSLFPQSFSTNIKPVDILSRLSMLLNRRGSGNYYKNYNILTRIKTITSILSIIGISCMFLTCLLFKDWLKQRIYTNQLCVSLLVQAIFFLLKTDLLNHIAYILFYYSILTQFVWMAFASYVQYVKFIKVFGNVQFNLTKSLIFGWGLPALVTTASTIIYKDCLKCEFCSTNDEIFKYFVILPIILIITCNIGVYIAVMINLWKSEIQESYKKYRIRATVAMPFMLGLVWIVLASVMAPDPIISLVGWYLFYFIVPSQGFVLFIFMVLLDLDTRQKWLELLRIKSKVL